MSGEEGASHGPEEIIKSIMPPEKTRRDVSIKREGAYQ